MEPLLDRGPLGDGALARRISGAAPGAASAEEDELCRRLGRRVRLYGLRHLGDEQSAADLVQRVLLLTLEKLRAGQVREPDRIASFALGTARLQAKEMRRGAQREVALSGDADSPAAPHADAPGSLDRKHLARCLEGLAERERSIVLLSFFREQTAPEIARALSLSEGNVRVIRHRAVGRLRDCMGLSGEALP